MAGSSNVTTNAAVTSVLNSTITNEGENGTIVVWSDEETSFNSTILAKDSQVEISSKDELNIATDNIQADTLLLDPKNIEIRDPYSGFDYLKIYDPNPSGTNNDFSVVKELDNGYFVATDYKADIGSLTDVGAVYLFDSEGSLISTLTGSTSSDNIGRSVTYLTNGNFVTYSSLWDNGNFTNAGAATWINGDSGLNGIISSTNSLIGTKTSDGVGSSVLALTNGNYVVKSYVWNNGSISDAGAVTWGDGSTGTKGEVTTSNSLVGSHANDKVGLNITKLSNGNYVVLSQYWDNGSATNAGAVTWASGTGPTSGVVDSSNSLVGSTTDDYVGERGIIEVANSNYVVVAPKWDNGSATNAGAVTWGSGTSGIAGVISSSNSLVGSHANDVVGASDYYGNVASVEVLTNGNYVVLSQNWANGAEAYAGAVTWGSGTSGVKGTISTSNSLIGSLAGSIVGSGGVTALANGNYVVGSPNYKIATNTFAGAATWGNGTTGVKGTISTSNSLVGSTQADEVGKIVVALTNGNYVVVSPGWDSASLTNAGAATWGSGTSGIKGTISTSNSLIGANTNKVNNATALTNGNYVVTSTNMVTWGNGTTGVKGTVDSGTNSFGMGTSYTGGVNITPLSNGNYVISSPYYNNGTASKAGAVTWADGTTPIIGEISSSNALMGSRLNDQVGENIYELSNGNYIVASRWWDDGIIENVGAVTWGSGTAQIATGEVSAANSLVGSHTNDYIGNGINSIKILDNGDYVLSSSFWDNGTILDAGAITWGDGTNGTTGVINDTNSLIGSSESDNLSAVITSNGNYIITSDYIQNGVSIGAVTFLNSGEEIVGEFNNEISNLFLGKYYVTELLNNKYELNPIDTSDYVIITDFTNISETADPVSSAVFSTNPTADSIITPDSIEALLDAGTDVVLQANNDITLSQLLSVNNGSGDGGSLTLQAGRNININEDIVTDNGNFTAIAGDTDAISDNTDAGTPTITIGSSASINAGTGDITLYANGGDFINNSGSTSPFTAGLTSIYLDSYTDATLNGLTIEGKRYNTTFNGGCLSAGCILPTSGVNLLYSLTPVLTVTPDSQSMTYGDTLDLTYSVSGFVDGDSEESAVSGTAQFSVGGSTSTSGNYIAGKHEVTYSSGLLSSLGYQIQDASASSDELTIDTKTLTVSGLTVEDKVYDSTIDASLSGTGLIDGIAGDDISFTASAEFTNKDVEASKTVNKYYTLDGADLGNYTLDNEIGVATSALITPKALVITGTTVDDKVYDGTTDATINIGTLSGFVGDETVTATAVGTFDSKNAGERTATAVYTLVDGTNGGIGTNYSLEDTTGLDATISPKDLTVNYTADDKIYDGTVDTTVSGSSTDIVEGDTLTYNGTAAFIDKNVGTGKTVNISSVTLGGDDALNYNLLNTSATSSANITPKNLTASYITNTKTYDGTTDATVTGDSNDIVSGDTVTFTQSAAFSNKDAGTEKTVNISGITLGGTDASNYNLTSNTASTTGTINPKTLTITGTTVADKTYDGTTDAVVTLGTLSGFVGDETVSANAVGIFDSKDAGDRTATISYTLANGPAPLDGDQGLAANYSLEDTTDTATISQKDLTVNYVADNKVYDGTTDAFVTGSSNDIISGDTVTFALDAAFSDKDAGAGKTINISSIVLGGDDALNYNLLSNTSSTTANITPKELTASYTADNKVYDGTTDATVSGSSTDIISGDAITFTQSAAFSNKNAGTGKTVNVSGITLGGDDALNYSLLNNTSSATAEITKKELTSISDVIAQDKVYDALTSATLDTSSATIIGTIDGDELNIASTTANFSDKNAGENKVVTVTTVSLGGNDASNYTVSNDAINELTATITPKEVSAQGLAAADKIYDGTRNGTLVSGSIETIQGDDIALNYSGTDAYSSKNVGTYDDTTFTLFFTGEDAGNYHIQNNGVYTLNSTIHKREIALYQSTAHDKIYDGTTTATLNDGQVIWTDGSSWYTNGLIQGDDISYSYDANFASKDVTTQTQSVTFSNIALSGDDSTNYGVSSFDNLVALEAKITPKSIDVTVSKTYDGSNSFNSGFELNTQDIIEGDTVNIEGTATVSSANADLYNSFTDSTLSLDNSNYTLTNGAVDATIQKKDATITATDSTVTYNGQTQSSIAYTVSGLVNSETASVLDSVSISGSGKDAGTYNITGTASDNNYNLSIVDGSLVIQKADAIVTANSNTVTYNGQEQSVSGFTASGLVNGETETVLNGVSTSGGAGTNAGEYTLTASGEDRNYNLTFVDGKLTIQKADAIVTANSDTVTYNGLEQSVSGFTASGLVNGETETVLNGVSTSGGAGTNAGEYTLTASGEDGNYNLTFVDGKLTIQKADAIVTANSDTVTYNGLEQSVSGFTASGLVNGETINVLDEVSGASVSGTNADTYSTSLTGTDENYNLTLVDGTLTIQKKDATITATDSTVTYNGQTQSSIAYTVSGLVNSETASVLDSVSISGSGKDAGTYNITGTATDNNYNLSIVDGSLVIQKADAIVTANSNTVTYNGLEQSVLGFTATGLVNNETETVLNGVSTSGGAGTNAGEYTLTASGEDGNYNLTFVDGKLTIQKADAIVTANSFEKFAGQNDPTLTYNTKGLIGNDKLLGTISRELGEAIGDYLITQGTLNSENYDITFNNGTLTIVSNIDPTQLIKVPAVVNQPVTNTQEVSIAQPNNELTLETNNLGNEVNIASTPIETQASDLVTLGELRNEKANENGSNQDFIVPLNKNSVISLVNGGVKLVDGLEQQFFVTSNENN